MIIVAENFNSSVLQIKQALVEENSAWLQALAKSIAEAGANYLDLNTAVFLDLESKKMLYLIETLKAVGLDFVIDSPDTQTIQTVLEQVNLPQVIINSITLEEQKFMHLISLAQKFDAGLICLPIKDRQLPKNSPETISLGREIIEKIREHGIADHKIYFDPMIKPLATDCKAAQEAFSSISQIRKEYPEIHIICGLSNISFGLPARNYLNRAFVLQAMTKGLDSAILNPLDDELMSLIKAAASLAGEDEYCENYLNNFRP